MSINKRDNMRLLRLATLMAGVVVSAVVGSSALNMRGGRLFLLAVPALSREPPSWTIPKQHLPRRGDKPRQGDWC